MNEHSNVMTLVCAYLAMQYITILDTILACTVLCSIIICLL